jgi:hypothetical protein
MKAQFDETRSMSPAVALRLNLPGILLVNGVV